jgi:hypothetical protein
MLTKKFILPVVYLLTTLLIWYLFAPGYLSWDSSNQFWQARHAEYNTIAPPLMSQIWNLALHASIGVSGFLLLQLLYYAGAVAFFVSHLTKKTGWRVSAFLFLLLWPPLLGLLPHLWKDMWSCASLVFSVAYLLADWRRPSGWHLFAAFCFALFACMFRENAISGIVPIAAWIGWRLFPLRRLYWLSSATGIIFSLFILQSLPENFGNVQKIRHKWSVVALWDLGSVSIQTGQVLIPSEVCSEAISVQDLQEVHLDYSVGLMAAHPKLINSFSSNYTASQRNALLRAWIQLPFKHPREYLIHRSKLLGYMLGFNLEELPDHQTYSPEITPYLDNPQILQPPNSVRDQLQKTLSKLVDGPLHWLWIYLCINLCSLLYCLRFKNHNPNLLIPAMILSSSWLYFLPFPLISGSAEFRYFNWPILSSLAALCLLISVRRSK